MSDQAIDPHPLGPDEDPEEHIGREIPDPWDDPEQTDWPMNPSGGGDRGVGDDPAPDRLP